MVGTHAVADGYQPTVRLEGLEDGAENQAFHNEPRRNGLTTIFRKIGGGLRTVGFWPQKVKSCRGRLNGLPSGEVLEDDAVSSGSTAADGVTLGNEALQAALKRLEFSQLGLNHAKVPSGYVAYLTAILVGADSADSSDQWEPFIGKGSGRQGHLTTNS